MTAIASNTRLVPWGLNAADRVLGPMVPGRLYVIGARPSCGKTVFTLNWLNAHARRILEAPSDGFMDRPRRVVAFLTERSPEVARVSWAAMRLGYDVDHVLCEEWDELPVHAKERFQQELEWVKMMEHVNLVSFVEGGNPTVQQIAEAVSDLRAQIVLFDFLQRVRPANGQRRWEAVGEAAQMFQSLAVRDGLVVIITSQLKRRGDGVMDKYRPPHLEDFKLSGDIEEVADVALGLFRPLGKITVRDEKEIRAGREDLERFKIHDTMAVKVLKHRYRGPAADRILFVQHKNGQLSDKERPEPPLNAGDAWEPEEEQLPF